LQFSRRIRRLPRKRAPFYSEAPGLGKRAAMLFLRSVEGARRDFATPIAAVWDKRQ
jgi:hypothetical protein